MGYDGLASLSLAFENEGPWFKEGARYGVKEELVNRLCARYGTWIVFGTRRDSQPSLFGVLGGWV